MLVAVGVSQAAFVDYFDSYPLAITNWSGFLTFPLYDPSAHGGQPLTAIDFYLWGHVHGSIAWESLDAAPATVTGTLQAKLTLTKPDLSVLVVIIPAASESDLMTAFDGTVDFGGGSGRSYPHVHGTASDSFFDVFAPDLLLFTGVGTINLPLDSLGLSTASGAGNLITQFSTEAEAEGRIRYFYGESIPEPSTLLLLGTGAMSILGYGWNRLRKRG